MSEMSIIDGAAPATDDIGLGGEAVNSADAFPSRLRAAIGQRSVRSFAQNAGLSDTVVRQYLIGKSEPTRPALLAMAKAAGVSPAWLLNGEGSVWPGYSDATTASPSGAPRIDVEALSSILMAVDSFSLHRGKEWTQQKKAKVVALLYSDYQQRGALNLEFFGSLFNVIE